MKSAYFGSGDFARVVLERLCQAGLRPGLIISQPDRRQGRGLKLIATPVSQLAERERLPLVKPALLKAEEFHSQLQSYQPDFIFTVDYGKILPDSVLAQARLGALGVHPSLLPRWRGAAPISRAIMNGDDTTGVTVFKMEAAFDSGAIIIQEKLAIEQDDDLLSLSDKLAKLGGGLLAKVIKQNPQGDFHLTPQDKKATTFAPKLKKTDGLIVWSEPAQRIRDLIRATLGWPAAYTYYKGKALQVLAAQVLEESASLPPATIVRVEKSGIDVATTGRVLRINTVKPPGRGPMPAYAFACGQRLAPGEGFGAGEK